MLRLAGVALLVVAVVAMTAPMYAAQDDEFVIGLIPEENIFKQIKKHQPLADYLSKKLGVKVKFTILSRYPDIIDRFVTRGMDGAFFGIFTGILAQEKLGVVPIARPVNQDGSTTAMSYIFARKDSGIRDAKAMRGKSAVFVDKATATGYLYMLAYLRQNGIRTLDGYFGDRTFTGSHDSVVYSVLSERADVGVAKGRIFEKMSKKDPLIKEELYIIAKSVELPDTTLCIRPDIAPELKEKLKDALLSMHKDPEGKDVLEGLDAIKFAPASKEDFDAVYRLAREAGIKNIRTFNYR